MQLGRPCVPGGFGLYRGLFFNHRQTPNPCHYSLHDLRPVLHLLAAASASHSLPLLLDARFHLRPASARYIHILHQDDRSYLREVAHDLSISQYGRHGLRPHLHRDRPELLPCQHAP